MDRNRVTVRYAKALIEVSEEKKVLSVIEADMKVLFKSIADFKGFEDYILNPGIKSSVKFEQLKELFATNFNSLTIQFLKLVFEKNREEYLKDISRNFIEMAKKLNNEISAELVTAKKISAALTQKLALAFSTKLNAKIELSSEENSDLIGGFIFTIDGQQYDASLARRIEKLKSQLQLK